MSNQILETYFSEIQKDLIALFLKKNADYGNAQIVEFGDVGIFIRANDKWERLKNLYKKGEAGIKVKNETIDDTWCDFAVYAVLALMYRRGCFDEEES